MRIPCLALIAVSCVFAQDIRIGIIGTDTSHATAFASILNNPSNKDHIPGARVVAAYKGGSPDVEESRSRVDKFAQELETTYGVEIVPDIPTLLSRVDAILLLSVDGRTHLPQFRQVAGSRKPVFIDKPLASTLDDARAIAQLAKETDTPWWSSSTLRYSSLLPALRDQRIQSVLAWGPAPLEAHHQLDLSWYGIHTAEIVYALLGPGCDEVTRVVLPDSDIVVGRWKDGRSATLRLSRGRSQFGVVVFSSESQKQSQANLNTGYRDLAVDFVRFFQTRQRPVPEAETLEIFAFLDAAQRSKEQGSKPVKLR